MLALQPCFDVEESQMDLAAMPPELRLMLAVIEDAIVTFQRGLISRNPMERRRGCEVEQWVSSRESDAVFSFENICSTLHLDADCVRDGLLRMKRRVHHEKQNRRRIRLRRHYSEGQFVPKGTVAEDQNLSRRRRRVKEEAAS